MTPRTSTYFENADNRVSVPGTHLATGPILDFAKDKRIVTHLVKKFLAGAGVNEIELALEIRHKFGDVKTNLAQLGPIVPKDKTKTLKLHQIIEYLFPGQVLVDDTFTPPVHYLKIKLVQVDAQVDAQVNAQVDVNIKVPIGLVGLLIGAKGTTFKSIVERSGGAQVFIPEVPDDDNDRIKTVSIKHSAKEVVEAAKAIIENILRHKRVFRAEKSLCLVPKDVVGTIIGKCGASIKNLQKIYGCQIVFDDKNISGEICYTIYGPAEGRKNCLTKIEEICDQCKSFAHFSTPPRSATATAAAAGVGAGVGKALPAAEIPKYAHPRFQKSPNAADLPTDFKFLADEEVTNNVAAEELKGEGGEGTTKNRAQTLEDNLLPPPIIVPKLRRSPFPSAAPTQQNRNLGVCGAAKRNDRCPICTKLKSNCSCRSDSKKPAQSPNSAFSYWQDRAESEAAPMVCNQARAELLLGNREIRDYDVVPVSVGVSVDLFALTVSNLQNFNMEL